MLVRWSNQESVEDWTQSLTGSAGSLRVSHGSSIQAVLQARQEILVYTDSAIYSLQYLGAPLNWGSQLLSDNISIVSINAAVFANGTSFWMGQDKFYKYDGRVQTLRCDLLRFVFDDIDRTQFNQVFCSTNEGFNEVWWFYCTKNAPRDASGVPMIDRYVVGGYYRVHAELGIDESLNAPGASYVPLAFAESHRLPRPGEKPGASAPNRFYMYGVIGRLAMLAASYELEATDPEVEVYE